MRAEGETGDGKHLYALAMFILINVALIGDVNITYILGIDIVVWIVFHVALDVVMMKRGTKEV